MEFILYSIGTSPLAMREAFQVAASLLKKIVGRAFKLGQMSTPQCSLPFH
jgi:hypothetical protein